MLFQAAGRLSHPPSQSAADHGERRARWRSRRSGRPASRSAAATDERRRRPGAWRRCGRPSSTPGRWSAQLRRPGPARAPAPRSAPRRRRRGPPSSAAAGGPRTPTAASHLVAAPRWPISTCSCRRMLALLGGLPDRDRRSGAPARARAATLGALPVREDRSDRAGATRRAAAAMERRPRQARSATSAAMLLGRLRACPRRPSRRASCPPPAPRGRGPAGAARVAVSSSTSMRVAIAPAMGPSTWATRAANFSSRRVPLAEEHPEGGLVGRHEAEVGLEPALHLLVGVRAAVVAFVMASRSSPSTSSRSSSVQVLLDAEVLVEHGLRDAGGLGHVVHRRERKPWSPNTSRAASMQLLAAAGGGESGGGRLGCHGHERRTSRSAGDRPGRGRTPQGCRPASKPSRFHGPPAGGALPAPPWPVAAGSPLLAAQARRRRYRPTLRQPGGHRRVGVEVGLPRQRLSEHQPAVLGGENSRFGPSSRSRRPAGSPSAGRSADVPVEILGRDEATWCSGGRKELRAS